MVYTQVDIDEVLSYSGLSIKEKEDELLRMDCSMYCHLGINSTEKEINEVAEVSLKIYTAAYKINPEVRLIVADS
jgi:hypothetical protein|tara:strand:- start:112 stop:336 length:225 start_codon:yes stop_codon:yes gene_type:complete